MGWGVAFPQCTQSLSPTPPFLRRIPQRRNNMRCHCVKHGAIRHVGLAKRKGDVEAIPFQEQATSLAALNDAATDLSKMAHDLSAAVAAVREGQ